jgi:hypothetical protein
MTGAEGPLPGGAFGALRRRIPQRDQDERCELCSEPLGSRHRHLLDPTSRQVLCSCDACGILFSSQAATRYRLIPDRVRFLPDFQMSEEVWAGLGIPVNMAFFQHSLPSGQVTAFYPSPAGATESLLSFETWEELEEANPVLRTMEPGVEALLVNRVGRSHQYFIASIDQCYRLVGIIRLGWRGLSGGTEVWKHVESFFAELRERATTVTSSRA